MTDRDPSGAAAPLDDDADGLVAQSRERTRLRLGDRERVSSLVVGGAFLAAAIPLAVLPTPLLAAPRLAGALGLGEVFVKRDDLTGFAFAATGMAATTYMRSWQDFEYVNLAMMPLFLFSTTFYQLGVYPRAIQIVVECTPLYQAVTLMRGLALGVVGPDLLWRAAYLGLMGLGGLYVAGRRVRSLLLT